MVSPNDLEKIPSLITSSKKTSYEIHESIKEIRSKTVYNLGQSAVIGAQYIQKLNEELN